MSRVWVFLTVTFYKSKKRRCFYYCCIFFYVTKPFYCKQNHFFLSPKHSFHLSHSYILFCFLNFYQNVLYKCTVTFIFSFQFNITKQSIGSTGRQIGGWGDDWQINRLKDWRTDKILTRQRSAFLLNDVTDGHNYIFFCWLLVED